MAKYYIGVDAGGTKCRMLLADAEMNHLAEAVIDSPSNLQLRGGNAAYESINKLTEMVCDQAGLDRKNASDAIACFGIAGGRLESARTDFAKRDFPFIKLEVYDDIDIARAGAHNGEDGAVLIIGTGSAGLSIVNGVRHQVGGWGFLVGDSMAGAILGRELLRYTLMATEGLVDPSPLTEKVMTHFDNDLNTMMAWSFDNHEARKALEQTLPPGATINISVPARPADYGQFVPLLFEYDKKGDPVAQKLVAFELDAVDLYVNWFTKRGAQSIAIVGGLGTYLLPRLQSRYGDIIVAPKASPLEGALIMARQMDAE